MNSKGDSAFGEILVKFAGSNRFLVDSSDRLPVVD